MNGFCGTNNCGSNWLLFLLLCGGCGCNTGCVQDTCNTGCGNVDICTLCLILLLTCGGGLGSGCDCNCG